jgi:hypothetical protein
VALQGIKALAHRAAEMRALSDEMKDVEVRSLILRLANANNTPLSTVRRIS